MSALSDQLQGIIEEAIGPGAVLAPADLLRVARQLGDPIRTLADWDKANDLFSALETEFEFINRARATNIPLQPAEMDRIVALMRWLIAELRDWRVTASDALPALTAALVVAQSCGSENDFWSLLPDDLGENRELIDYLGQTTAAFAVEIKLSSPHAREWERAALAKFEESDRTGDWPAIVEGWKAFERVPFVANALQTQTILFLYRYAHERLVASLLNVRQMAVAMQVTSVLDSEQRLRVSLTSANPYIQLAAAYQTVSQPRTMSGLSTSATRLLCDLLIKVAEDKPRWGAWLKIFNTYPVRFPYLQASLGQALAKTTNASLEAYVESIWLYPKPTAPDAGRRCVADCLRAFREHAAPERRQALWTAAHHRWIQWNFGVENSDEHLFRIAWCDLDYALVGYAIECMDETARTHAIAAISGDLQNIDDQWHASETAIITEWNRLLSRLQPYAFANNVVRDGSDWLTESQTCWPFDPTRATYFAMKYRLQ